MAEPKFLIVTETFLKIQPPGDGNANRQVRDGHPRELGSDGLPVRIYFLDPAISYQVAQQVAGNERLSVSEQMLRQRLRERNLLASVDVGRQMLTVRRTLGGRPRQVLHLKANDLLTRKSG